MLIDNVTIAILTKVNELAERHGVKPIDFIATFRTGDEPNRSRLSFETAPDSPEKQQALFRVMDAINMHPDGELRGSCEEIYNALDQAILVAPKPRRLG